MATDTTVSSLIINKLTKAQYDAIADPSDTELYLVPDEIDNSPTSGSSNPVTSDGIYNALAGKQATISDLATIRSGAALGATALQSFTEADPVFSSSVAAGITSTDITNWNNKTSNVGTITGITMNGASKGNSGVVDLGTVLTAHQAIGTIAITKNGSPWLTWVPTTTGTSTFNLEVPTSFDGSLYVQKSGATMTGALIAQNNTNYTTAQVRNIYISTTVPDNSVGGNGDIWIVYTNS